MRSEDEEMYRREPKAPKEAKLEPGEVDNTTEEEKTAYHTQHRCTDVICVPLFFSTLILLVYILHYTSIHGDMARITHGLNMHNELCGYTEAVQDKPFLFWCTKPGAAMTAAALRAAGIAGGDNASALGEVMGISSLLDLAHPICVASCPADTSTYHQCFQREETTDFPADASGTFTRNVTFIYDLVESHPTTKVVNRYCIPQSPVLLEQLKSALSSGMEGVMFHLQEVADTWQLIGLAGLVAFILGYVYLFAVKTLARPLIYATFVISSVACLGFGGYMMLGIYSQDLDTSFAQHFANSTVLQDANVTSISDIFVPSTGIRNLDIAISGTLLGIGLLIPIALCCMQKSIDLVLGSLAATLECLQDMPILLLQPLFSVLLKMMYLSVAAVGMAWVISIGQVSNYSVSSYVPAGLTRSFEFSDDQMWYVAGYFFIAAWFYEFGAALEQFVFIYGVQMWFFAPYTTVLGIKKKSVNQLKIFRGLFLGLTYHVGTLAFGSLLLAIFRGLYLVLSIVYKQAKAQAGETNQAVDAAAGCCLCCLKCWENIVRYLNKMCYIVVMMNSQSFCSAAETMLEVMASEFMAMGMLEGVTKLFQAGGLVSISSAGAYLTWFTLRNVSYFSDPSSAHFVPQPEYVTIAAGVVSALIAWVFMAVFDVVSDTILFCWALDKKIRRERGQPPNANLPASLVKLLNEVPKSDEQERLVR